MIISSRSRTTPFLALDVLAEATAIETAARADGGPDVIHLEVGEPGKGAPRAAREAVMAALAEGDPLGYTTGLGRQDLREAIAGLYGTRYGLELDPARVIVTAGSSGAFVLAFLTFFDAGARVALAEPGYPAYRKIMEVLGIEVVGLPATIGTGYQPTPEALSTLGRLDGLMIASPANPTGTMLSETALAGLGAWCREQGAVMVADEIYHGLSFGEAAGTALRHLDEAVIVSSFSKYHCMTGWRIGWMVVPDRAVRRIETLAQSLFICAPHVSQIAALGALSPEGEAELAAHLDDYRAARSVVLAALDRLGFTDIAPADGAFYAYATLPEGAPDSPQFCKDLLAAQRIATTPGVDFDPRRGHRTVRISFCQPVPVVEEGMARLARHLGRN